MGILVRATGALILVAAGLASGLVLISAPPAAACSCVTDDLRQLAERADAAFVGTVEQVTSTDDRATLDYTVRVSRTWTADVNAEVVVSSATNPASCGLGQLNQGVEYLFLVDRQAPPYAANICGGSRPAGERAVATVSEALGPPGRPTPLPPPTAERTPVNDAEPTSFTRLAVPGAAMILIGVLGLVVVRRLTRS